MDNYTNFNQKHGMFGQRTVVGSVPITYEESKSAQTASGMSF